MAAWLMHQGVSGKVDVLLIDISLQSLNSWPVSVLITYKSRRFAACQTLQKVEAHREAELVAPSQCFLATNPLLHTADGLFEYRLFKDMTKNNLLQGKTAISSTCLSTSKIPCMCVTFAIRPCLMQKETSTKTTTPRPKPQRCRRSTRTWRTRPKWSSLQLRPVSPPPKPDDHKKYC